MGTSAVTLTTLDPAAGYRASLVERFLNARLVVNHFHAIKLANAAIDDIPLTRLHEHTYGTGGLGPE